MNKNIFPLLLLGMLSACIGDDILLDTVNESVKITLWVDTLAVNDQMNFEARYTDQVGQTVDRNIVWTSSDPAILEMTPAGEATGITKGNVFVYATADAIAGGEVSDSVSIVVDEVTSTVPLTERSGTIQTTSSYQLEGSFTIKADGNDLVIEIADDYKASSALPGLYLYMTNNPSTNNNALEVAAVQVFDGAHTYRVEGVELSEYDYLLYYCKPFNVKVGDAEIEQ